MRGGNSSEDIFRQLLRGIHLADGWPVAAIKVRRRHAQSTELEVTLNEGRNRESVACWPGWAIRSCSCGGSPWGAAALG